MSFKPLGFLLPSFSLLQLSSPSFSLSLSHSTHPLPYSSLSPRPHRYCPSSPPAPLFSLGPDLRCPTPCLPTCKPSSVGPRACFASAHLYRYRYLRKIPAPTSNSTPRAQVDPPSSRLLPSSKLLDPSPSAHASTRLSSRAT